jgi:peptide/nickel transport system permease protein
VSRVADPLPAPAPEAEQLAIADTAVNTSAADLLLDAAPRRRPWWVPVATYVVTVFVLITLNFALPRLMPGDPIDALMAFGSPTYVQNDDTRAKLEKYYGLDESLPAQYVNYLGRLAHGDLGQSTYDNVPVRGQLGGRIAWTALLLSVATALSIVIGLPLGIHSGWKRGQRVDRRLLASVLALQHLPIFVVGAVAFTVFSARMGLFPLGGASTPFTQYSGLQMVVDVGRHLALPALLLAMTFATEQYLVMRSSMVSELGADYLLGGRAKGLRERRLKYRYAGRNALLPVVTVIGLEVGLSVTGLIFIESIFNYPGIGGYMLSAIFTRDYPSMQGAFLVLTLSVVTANFLVDMLYRRLDPRTVR